MASAASTVRIPKWTKRVFTELSGRDPLGLSRVSFLITDYLLKGIITTTSQARYYSFYPWALWHIEQWEQPTRYTDFITPGGYNSSVANFGRDYKPAVVPKKVR
jgi:hypothetical protein